MIPQDTEAQGQGPGLPGIVRAKSQVGWGLEGGVEAGMWEAAGILSVIPLFGSVEANFSVG